MPKLIARWNSARDAWEATTPAGLFCEHSGVYSATWPTSGMTCAGTAYELPTSARRTGATASSSLLATPTRAISTGGPPQDSKGKRDLRLDLLGGGKLFSTPESKLSDSGPDYARTNRPDSGGDDLTTTVFKNLLPTPVARDAKGTGLPTRQGGATLHDALLPTPRASDGLKGSPNQKGGRGDLMLTPAGDATVPWGQYEPAVRRWEHLLGRPAPAPTETSTRGGQRLSPRFVEWMMGWPDGHVTGVAGVTRNAQLKILGNGVVPQQAEAALRILLAIDEAAAA